MKSWFSRLISFLSVNSKLISGTLKQMSKRDFIHNGKVVFLNMSFTFAISALQLKSLGAFEFENTVYNLCDYRGKPRSPLQTCKVLKGAGNVMLVTPIITNTVVISH